MSSNKNQNSYRNCQYLKVTMLMTNKVRASKDLSLPTINLIENYYCCCKTEKLSQSSSSSSFDKLFLSCNINVDRNSQIFQIFITDKISLQCNENLMKLSKNFNDPSYTTFFKLQSRKIWKVFSSLKVILIIKKGK